MRPYLLVSCSLLAACATASPDHGEQGPGDGPGSVDAAPDSTTVGPDAVPDPRRGWIDLGSPPGATAGDVSSPRLTIVNGAPVVAYSADNYVHVLAYQNDTAWTPLGTPLRQSSNTNAVTYDPTPVVTADGLSVVWPEWSSGAMSSSVRRQVAGSWVAPPGAATLGTPGAYSFVPGAATLGTPGAYSFVPHSTAAVDTDGSMWIAYSETSDLNGPMRISVVSLLGSDMFQRGTAISAGTNSGALAPDLALGGGSQFMTWTEDGVRLARRNTSTGAWEPFGGSPLTVAGRAASSQNNGHLTVDTAGRPIVAFTSSDGTEHGIYVARWDGSAWTYWQQALQANTGMVNGSTTFPYLFDIVGGGPDTVYIAWSEVDASTKDGIYVYKCTPSGCAPVGRGRLDAATGNTPGYGPRLAVDAAGRPLVTWVEDDAAGVSQVRVWRYHGDPDGP